MSEGGGGVSEFPMVVGWEQIIFFVRLKSDFRIQGQPLLGNKHKERKIIPTNWTPCCIATPKGSASTSRGKKIGQKSLT
jgi:hypothetical protein